MSNKEKILTNKILCSNKKNSMGCSEDWYDEYFAIQHTFTEEEIKQMTEQEINNLIKLAQNIQEALY